MPKTDLVTMNVRAVEAARLRRLWTLATLGQRSGVCRATLYVMRAGRPISLVSARALAKALKVSLRSLLAAVPDAADKIPSDVADPVAAQAAGLAG
jgi:hypothetical protein